MNHIIPTNLISPSNEDPFNDDDATPLDNSPELPTQQQGKRHNRRRIRHRPRRARPSCGYCIQSTPSTSPLLLSPPPGFTTYYPNATPFARSNTTTTAATTWSNSSTFSQNPKTQIYPFSISTGHNQIWSSGRLKRGSTSTIGSSVYFPPSAQEDSVSRDRRFFGGTVEDDDADGDADLRGAMLDVVLGLFDGMDYED